MTPSIRRLSGRVRYALLGLCVALGTMLANIPGDVTYSVKEEQRIPNVKRSVNVRLNKEVTKEVLAELGRKIRAAEPQPFQRTFILYYLPGMEEGKGAWAYTHFTPELELKILGFSPEEKRAAAQDAPPNDARVIGEWMDNGPAARGIRILQKGDQFVMSMKFKDGSSLDAEVVTRTTSEGLWFAKKTNARGDYYIVNKAGDLESRDADGLIAKFPKKPN